MKRWTTSPGRVITSTGTTGSYMALRIGPSPPRTSPRFFGRGGTGHATARRVSPDEREGGELGGEGGLSRHAALSEYRIVRATIPFPARPMETSTGVLRPGTVSLRTRIEYAGEVAKAAVEKVRSRRCGRGPSRTRGTYHCPPGFRQSDSEAATRSLSINRRCLRQFYRVHRAAVSAYSGSRTRRSQLNAVTPFRLTSKIRVFCRIRGSTGPR
jgi:hypothetical protein